MFLLVTLAVSVGCEACHDCKPKTSAYLRPKNHVDLHPSKFHVSKRCGHPPCSGQIHLQLGGPGEMVVSFASQPESPTKSRVRFGREALDEEAMGKVETYSQLMYWSKSVWDPKMKGGYGLDQEIIAEHMSTDTWAQDDATGWKFPSWRRVGVQQVKNQMGWYKNPGECYDSPAIHTVVLAGLKPGEKYIYQVENDERIFGFTMPAEEATYPFHVGLMGDVGQTPVSNSSMHLLKDLRPDVVLSVGDLSYANGFYPRWDSFDIMFETLGSQIPVMHCPGNHEYSYGEALKSYNARYPMPHAQSGSVDNTYWSRDIGPMHVISLNSYASSKPAGFQYKWLERDLKSFSRERTPWLVVIMHSPFYNSNLQHYGETKPMVNNLEEMFFKHGVNLVIAGHVHAYERTWPTYRNKTNPCGPVYITIGDGGNRGGPNYHWLPFEGESWSAFRQGSFGIGDLRILNHSHAFLTWKRNACFDSGQVDFDASNCSSRGDNSETSLAPDDTSWVVRLATCRNQEPLV